MGNVRTLCAPLFKYALCLNDICIHIHISKFCGLKFTIFYTTFSDVAKWCWVVRKSNT